MKVFMGKADDMDKKIFIFLFLSLALFPSFKRRSKAI